MKLSLKSLYSLTLLLGIASFVAIAPSSAKAAEPNLLPNASVEQVDPSTSAEPRYWNFYKEGAGNNARFTYEKTSRTGTRSMKITTTQYTSGSARWSFDPS